jgi:hypothetical protein
MSGKEELLHPLGPFCERVGTIITRERLLQQLQHIDTNKFTNGHLFEIGTYLKNTSILWKDVQEALALAYGKEWSYPGALAEKFNGMFHPRQLIIKYIMKFHHHLLLE